MIFPPVPSSLHDVRVRGEKWSPAEGGKRKPGVAVALHANLGQQGRARKPESSVCSPLSCHRRLPSSPVASSPSGTASGSGSGWEISPQTFTSPQDALLSEAQRD